MAWAGGWTCSAVSVAAANALRAELSGVTALTDGERHVLEHRRAAIGLGEAVRLYDDTARVGRRRER